jgi:hypothetical protein
VVGKKFYFLAFFPFALGLPQKSICGVFSFKDVENRLFILNFAEAEVNSDKLSTIGILEQIWDPLTYTKAESPIKKSLTTTPIAKTCQHNGH